MEENWKINLESTRSVLLRLLLLQNYLSFASPRRGIYYRGRTSAPRKSLVVLQLAEVQKRNNDWFCKNRT